MQTLLSDEDYEHTQNVWALFKRKTIKDYYDLYLQSDVLLLADVFENLKMSMNSKGERARLRKKIVVINFMKSHLNFMN